MFGIFNMKTKGTRLFIFYEGLRKKGPYEVSVHFYMSTCKTMFNRIQKNYIFFPMLVQGKIVIFYYFDIISNLLKEIRCFLFLRLEHCEKCSIKYIHRGVINSNILDSNRWIRAASTAVQIVLNR